MNSLWWPLRTGVRYTTNAFLITKSCNRCGPIHYYITTSLIKITPNTATVFPFSKTIFSSNFPREGRDSQTGKIDHVTSLPKSNVQKINENKDRVVWFDKWDMKCNEWVLTFCSDAWWPAHQFTETQLKHLINMLACFHSPFHNWVLWKGKKMVQYFPLT